MSSLFSFLLPVASTILGGVLFSLDFKKEIRPSGQPVRKISILLLAALLSYLIYIYATNAIDSDQNSQISTYVVSTSAILDGISQILFDIVAILHTSPLLTKKQSQMGIWVAIVPSIAYFCANAVFAAGHHITTLNNFANFSAILRITEMALAFFRCILHAGLCFLASMAKVKSRSSFSSDQPISISIFTPVVTSLFFLVACAIGSTKYEWGQGLIVFTFSLNFWAFYVLDRFIVGK